MTDFGLQAIPKETSTCLVLEHRVVKVNLIFSQRWDNGSFLGLKFKDNGEHDVLTKRTQ